MRKVLLLTLSAVVILPGCALFDHSLPAINVALTPSSAQMIDQGQTVAITAAVTNDPANKGVTWTLTGSGCSGNACGTLGNMTATAVTYAAPAALSSPLTVTVTATSVADTTKSAADTITVEPPPAISTASLPTGTVGTSYSATLQETGGVQTFTWSVAVGTLPAGLTLNASTGVISGTPTTAGTSTFTVKVADSAAPSLSAQKQLTLTINPPPLAVSTTSLPGGTVSSTYSATLQSSGGTPPVAWSITAGALPGGLALNASTGAISGAPTASGTFNITVQAADSGTPPQTATKALSISVNPALSITTTSLANGTVGTAYSATLASNGGTAPVSWSITVGTLPAGLTLNTGTGAISGTPTTAGTSNFTVQAKDASTPQQAVTQALSLTINPAPLVVTTVSLPSAAVGIAYSATLASSGGTSPVTWSVTVGTLPAGLALNAATGAITGTPTTAGTFNFTVQAADSGVPQQTATKALSIVVNPSLGITTTSLPSGVVGMAYSATLQSSGGTAPISWSVTVGTLPAGLALNAGTGAITGTPTTAGTSNFTVQAKDSGTPQQTATQALSITVNSVLAITTASLANGVVGTAYNATLQSSGGAAPISWSVTVGTLPAGLALNASTGAITGTPTTAGTSNFTVQAADSATPAQKVTKALSITINPALSITTTSLAAGTAGTAYSATLQSTGGVAPITWSVTVGVLPAGLALNASTGAITGTPTTAGTSNFTVQAVDSGTPQQTATQALSLTINPAALVITTSSLPTGAVSAAYSVTLQSSGGTAPVTWSVTVGTLPTGLALNSGTGAITGTPTTAGTSNFSVQAADSSIPVQKVTQALSITVNPALTVTTTSLAAGTVGTAYSATLTSSGGTAPVSWSITVGTLPAGLALTASTGAITGTPTTAGTSNFTVQAADSSTPQQTATKALSITVNPAPLAVTTTSLANGVVGTAYSATLASSGGTAPVSWSVTVGTLPAGLALNASTGAITGTPTTAGTSNFTVQAADSSIPQQTATKALSITIINAGVNNAELKGQYAFELAGFDAGGPVTIVGSFSADGLGNITGGIQDVNRNSGVTLSQAFAGTYAVNADNRGSLTITSSPGGVALGTFRFALGVFSAGVSTRGQIIEFDTSGTRVAGVIAKQDTTAFSTASITGDFAFGASSAKSGGGRFAVAGRYTVSNGSITAGNFDTDDTSVLTTNGTFTGSLSVAATGRGLFTFNITGAPTPVNGSIYVVSATEMLAMSIDPQTTNVPFAGSMLKQAGGPFSNASMNGVSVLAMNGRQSSTGNSQVLLGLITANGAGGFSLTADENKGGVTTSRSFSGTYAVAANGRMTVSVTGQANAPVFYLVAANKLFVVSTDSSVQSGWAEPQTGGPFSAASINGAYIFGNVMPASTNVTDESGVVTSNGTGAITGTEDFNQTSGLFPDQPLTDTATVAANGRVTTTGGAILYLISPSKAFEMDGSSLNPGFALIQK